MGRKLVRRLQVKPLPFELDALEPVISAETMDAHYNGHYRNYIKKYNRLISKDYRNPEEINFNRNGAFLHEFYWESLIPGGRSEPSELLIDNFSTWFGGRRDIVRQLKEITGKIQGSGWGLLLSDKEGRIKVGAIQNHRLESVIYDNLLLVVDIFEHSYYLDYLYHKESFLDNFMDLINWDVVEERYLLTL